MLACYGRVSDYRDYVLEKFYSTGTDTVTVSSGPKQIRKKFLKAENSFEF